MERASDNRFKLGFAGLVLMIGISFILNYLSNNDLYLVLAVFFLGMALILAFLSIFVGERNFYLFGFSVFLLFLGLVFTFSHPSIINVDIGVLIGVFLIFIVLIFLGYSFRMKKGGEKLA